MKPKRKVLPVPGVPVDVAWVGYDPTDWRNHPEPEDQDLDDDDEIPTPEDVESISGINPDKEGW